MTYEPLAATFGSGILLMLVLFGPIAVFERRAIRVVAEGDPIMPITSMRAIPGWKPPRRKLGEGSWIADGYMPLQWRSGDYFVWVPCGDGHVLRWLDRSYQLRIR